MTPQSFDEITSWSREGDGWEGRIDASWMQGRGAFGGIVAGAAVRALEQRVSRPLRGLDGAFLGPLVADVPARVEVSVLREGRSVTFASADVTQEGRPVARYTAVLAEPRPSGIRVEAPPPGTRPPRSGAPTLEAREGVPAFIRHLDISLTEGRIPFTGRPDPGVACWCRFRRPATGAAGLIALADAPPPPFLPMLQAPAPASTVRWSAQILGPLPAAHEGDFWYRSTCTFAADGYAIMQAFLYDADDRPVVWLEQLAAVFDGISRT